MFKGRPSRWPRVGQARRRGISFQGFYMNLYKSPKLRPNLRIWETGNEPEQQEPNKLCTWTSSVEFLRSTGSFGFYRIQVPSLDIFNIFGGIYNFSFSVDPIIKIFYDPITCRINLCPLKVFQIRYSLSWEQHLKLSFLTTMVPSCLWLSNSPVLVLSQGLWTCSFFYSHHHSPGFHIAGSFSAFRSQSSQLYPSSFHSHYCHLTLSYFFFLPFPFISMDSP